LVGKSKGKDHWEEQDIGGWTVIKWILERSSGMVWIGLIWLRIGPVEGSCEHGIEILGGS
jgi:hypothetical protein